MSIEIPDWVVEAALTAYMNAWDESVTKRERCLTDWNDDQIDHAREGVKAALSAALEGWLQEVGYTNAEEMRELLAGRGGWVSGLELDGDTETLYTIRKEPAA